MTIVDGSQPTRFTLVWSDAPIPLNQVPTAFYSTINNLDLVVFAVACSPCYCGNNFDWTTGYTKGTSSLVTEGRNNVEEVVIPPGTFPSGTVLTMQVTGASIVADGIHPNNPPCVPPGTTGCEQDFAVFGTNVH